MKLLHLDSSIQGDGSASQALSAAIVARLQALDPSLQVTRRDLASEPLPHITFSGFSTPLAEAVLEEFLAADIVVLGAPMYNFGIPTQLKAWFDHIVVAGQTFSYGPDGVVGLAAGKRVFVAQSRGGIYAPDTPAAPNEHAESHLRSLLAFIGITDVQFIVAEGLALGADHRDASLARARQRVDDLELAEFAVAA